jgi:polysaccharide biosynthesis protein PslG
MLQTPRGRAAPRLALGLALLAYLAIQPAARPTASAQAVGPLRPYSIAIAPGNQHWPAAYGDWVVWYDEMRERPVIRANHLPTGAEIPLSPEGALPAGAPSISGTTVVWSDRRGETPTTPWADPHVYAYDLRARRSFLLAPVQGAQVEARVDGSLVVWTDYRDSPERGDIYGYDLSTGQPFTAIVHPAHQAQPAVSGRVVVWQDWRSGQSEIYAHDLASGQVWPLTTQPGPYERPLISGGRVVWLDSTGGVPTIAVYQLATRTLQAPVPGRMPLALDGDTLVMENATGDAILLYDLVSGTLTPLASSPAGAPEAWASLGGGTVAWTDYRNSELQWRPPGTRVTNQDIFAARLNAPPLAAQPRPNIPYRAASPEYGMNLFVWDAPAATGSQLRKLTSIGFDWQKTRIPWAEVESRKGQFNWEETDRIVQASNAAGVKVIARVDVAPGWARPDQNPHGPPLDYADYANFIHALVDRYRTGSTHGRLHAVEVWNEPNLHKEWGNQPINRQQAAEYTRLLRGAYEAAKRADPNVTIVTGSLSPTGWNDDTARPDDIYLHWLYQAGAASWFDALGVHGAGYGSAPETVPMTVERYPHPSFYFRRAEQLREIMVQYGDSDKQIWMMEFGWTTDPVNPSYAWYRVTEAEKGDYLVRAYRLARERWAPWIGVMALWTMPDPRWTARQEEYHWAVLDPDGTERESYRRLVQAYEGGQLGPRRGADPPAAMSPR